MEVGHHEAWYFVQIGKMARTTARHMGDPTVPGKPNALVARLGQPYFYDKGMRVWLYRSHIQPVWLRRFAATLHTLYQERGTTIGNINYEAPLLRLSRRLLERLSFFLQYLTDRRELVLNHVPYGEQTGFDLVEPLA